MKNLIVFFLFILFIGKVYSQVEWVHPTPTSNELNQILFLDNNTGFMVGACGTILKTIDGGKSWQNKSQLTISYLSSVYFIDNKIGFTFGSDGVIFKTTDCGETWNKKESTTNYPLTAMSFGDNNIGYIAGWWGMLLKTTDCGGTWTKLPKQKQLFINSIYFFDANNGFAAAGDPNNDDNKGAKLIQTTDGGNTWKIALYDYFGWYNYIYVTDDKTMFVAQDGGQIYRTTNRGIVWDYFKNKSSNNDIYSMSFANNSIGYAVGKWGIVLKTIDSGHTWQQISFSQPKSLYSTYFINDTTGFAVGSGPGTLIKTTNGGVDWTKFTSSLVDINDDFYTIYFKDKYTGFVLGEWGTLLKTTDSGYNWNKVEINTGQTLFSIKFINQNLGFICGMQGTLLKTTDGGSSWIKLSAGLEENLSTIIFRDSLNGFIFTTYPDNKILKSTDGGNTWEKKELRLDNYITSADYVDDNNILAVGYGGTMIRTSDDGVNWKVVSTGTTNSLYSIKFVNNKIGYITGGNGTIMKTTDSGNSWNYLDSKTKQSLDDIYFMDENNGFISSHGFILKTTDGGTSWDSLFCQSEKFINSLSFIDNNIGYLAGDDGSIIRIKVNKLTGIENINVHNNISDKFLLSQHYPNPFNPATTIKFTIVKQGTVNISVYNILGEKIREIVNREFIPGDHEVKFNAEGLTSGVYFYKIEAGNFCETKKMILIK